ncbi:hypothetical protein Z042_04660 [Chania multitudinisentens RB-25]|uniref:Uncharacterized protein n=1 Tax=Chania multitudinisentens RB-25 TaxID=1441930 RepID=W0LFZ8_9GAMM|nr:hypothetical protein Z042_04660 [Chania multitudinisentens RB-25]
MGSHPDKNWQKFHHQGDKVAVKAVPVYSEKYLNQNWQQDGSSLSQKTRPVEPAGFYAVYSNEKWRLSGITAIPKTFDIA